MYIVSVQHYKNVSLCCFCYFVVVLPYRHEAGQHDHLAVLSDICVPVPVLQWLHTPHTLALVPDSKLLVLSGKNYNCTCKSIIYSSMLGSFDCQH